MKKLFFICLLCLLAHISLFAQAMPHYGQVKLKTQQDYRQADSMVMHASNYLLSSPINQDTALKLNAAQFLMKWMDGTTDYTFVISDNTTKYFINDINLMAVYMAAMCKSTLHYKPGIESKKITLYAVKLLLDYTNNTSNKVKRTDQMKDLSDANDKGELETFLNL